jgi:beta-glucosidase
LSEFDKYEGEGIDRPFQLPEFQDELIQNVSRMNPRTVVVLHGGSSFDVQPWVHRVSLLKAEFKDHHDEDRDLERVSFTVTNTGKRAGAEVVELYVGEENPMVPSFWVNP